MAVQPIREVSERPAAVLLDAMGTLLRFAPPAPLLRDALHERLGVDVGDTAARAAMRAEIAHYRAHLHTGRDAASLAALRRASAEAMRPALGPAADAPGSVLTDALLAALRFEAFPDAPPALRTLRAAGLRLVVVSNWDVSLAERLEETGLAPLVDGAVASAPFGAAKPDPSIFAHALAVAGAPAARAWHVGDDVAADVAGARAAGLHAVLLARDGAPADPGAPVIRSLAELPELLGLRTAAEYPPWRSR
jgi:putative hydrolase of the HAD superfamily